jgi:hypothetical protein
MITNSIVVWIISLFLFATGLLAIIQVGVRYQGLQHQTENMAIEIARLAVNQDEASKSELCKSAKSIPPVRIRTCEILTDSVNLSAVEPISLLGYTYILQADSRVGYGFYSQIDPR